MQINIGLLKRAIVEGVNTEVGGDTVWLASPSQKRYVGFHTLNSTITRVSESSWQYVCTREEYETALNVQKPTVSRCVVKPLNTDEDGGKYETTIYGLCGTPVRIDVYRVLDAYPQTNPALEHLIKKALKPGKRGHKDLITDLKNIIESAQKALILEEQKNAK